MSQFEYVSVAIALVFTLAVGRVLAGVQDAANGDRRYLVHSGWLAHILLTCIAQWWVLWRLSTVEWSAFRFLWVLATPILQYLRAAVLLGTTGSVVSYRDHFYRVHKPFFALAAVISIHMVLSPWVLGVLPWLTPGPVHTQALAVAMVALVGFASQSPRVHATLVCLALGLTVLGFALLPSAPIAAQQAVAADTQQLASIDPWYRSGGERRAPALAVSAVGRS